MAEVMAADDVVRHATLGARARKPPQQANRVAVNPFAASLKRIRSRMLPIPPNGGVPPARTGHRIR